MEVKFESINHTSAPVRQWWWTRGQIHVPGFDILTFFCLSLIIIHSIIEFSGGVIEYEALYTQTLGLSTNGLRSGKFWQLLTHALLHGNWLHLFTNIIILWIMGGRLLVIIGQKKLAATMLLSCLGGGLVFVLFDYFSGVSRPLIGASGVACGLFVLMALLGPCAKVWLLPISAKNMAYGLLLASLALCLINPDLVIPVFKNVGIWLNSIYPTDVFRVAHACHLGGGIVGIYMSKRVIGKLVTLEDIRRRRID